MTKVDARSTKIYILRKALPHNIMAELQTTITHHRIKGTPHGVLVIDPVVKAPKVHRIYLADRSGSMGSVRVADHPIVIAKRGVERMVRTEGAATTSLILFDHEVLTILDVGEKYLHSQQWADISGRGGTNIALAYCEAISVAKLKGETDPDALFEFVMLSDGESNPAQTIHDFVYLVKAWEALNLNGVFWTVAIGNRVDTTLLMHLQAATTNVKGVDKSAVLFARDVRGMDQIFEKLCYEMLTVKAACLRVKTNRKSMLVGENLTDTVVVTGPTVLLTVGTVAPRITINVDQTVLARRSFLNVDEIQGPMSQALFKTMNDLAVLAMSGRDVEAQFDMVHKFIKDLQGLKGNGKAAADEVGGVFASSTRRKKLMGCGRKSAKGVVHALFERLNVIRKGVSEKAYATAAAKLDWLDNVVVDAQLMAVGKKRADKFRVSDFEELQQLRKLPVGLLAAADSDRHRSEDSGMTTAEMLEEAHAEVDDLAGEISMLAKYYACGVVGYKVTVNRNRQSALTVNAANLIIALDLDADGNPRLGDQATALCARHSKMPEVGSNVVPVADFEAPDVYPVAKELALVKAHNSIVITLMPDYAHPEHALFMIGNTFMDTCNKLMLGRATKAMATAVVDLLYTWLSHFGPDFCRTNVGNLRMAIDGKLYDDDGSSIEPRETLTAKRGMKCTGLAKTVLPLFFDPKDADLLYPHVCRAAVTNVCAYSIHAAGVAKSLIGIFGDSIPNVLPLGVPEPDVVEVSEQYDLEPDATEFGSKAMHIAAVVATMFVHRIVRQFVLDSSHGNLEALFKDPATAHELITALYRAGRNAPPDVLQLLELTTGVHNGKKNIALWHVQAVEPTVPKAMFNDAHKGLQQCAAHIRREQYLSNKLVKLQINNEREHQAAAVARKEAKREGMRDLIEAHQGEPQLFTQAMVDEHNDNPTMEDGFLWDLLSGWSGGDLLDGVCCYPNCPDFGKYKGQDRLHRHLQRYRKKDGFVDIRNMHSCALEVYDAGVKDAQDFRDKTEKWIRKRSRLDEGKAGELLGRVDEMEDRLMVIYWQLEALNGKGAQ